MAPTQRNIEAVTRYAPWLYLAACLLAYTPLIPQLGYYWDDWPIILFIHNKQWGQLLTHFSYDRPFSPWPFFIIGQLGTRPLVWHISALLMRWLGVLGLAWSLKPLWPTRPRFILYVALLFAVYPGYLAQPVSVTFATQLGAQIAFFVSLGAMARAASHPQRYWRYTALGLAAAVVHLFTMEYFAGLDLLRLLFLWLILRRQHSNESFVRTAKRVAIQWAPYLLVLAAWLVWRFWLLELPQEPYPLQLSRNPLRLIAQLAPGALRDFWHALAQVWARTLHTKYWPAWFIGGLSMLSFAWLLSRHPKEGNTEPLHQAALLGVAAFFLGLLPIWITGNQANTSGYESRYLMAGLMGAALLVVWALTTLIRSTRWRAIALAVLLGLAVSSHIENAQSFRQDWQAQRNLYWQLHWRAPDIAPGTAIITPDRQTQWIGEPLLGAALNTLYPIRSAAPAADLWNLELRYSHTLDPILRGEGYDINYRGHIFQADPGNLLLVRMGPEGSCLWTLDAYDQHNPYLTDEERQVAEYSNLARILAQGSPPDPLIFGAEPRRGWCYYYQQAQLANQNGAPAAAAQALQAAERAGLQPALSIEWLPLVRAYAALGEWPQAAEASQRVLADGPQAGAMLCALWADWSAPQMVYEEISQRAGCD